MIAGDTLIMRCVGSQGHTVRKENQKCGVNQNFTGEAKILEEAPEGNIVEFSGDQAREMDGERREVQRVASQPIELPGYVRAVM